MALLVQWYGIAAFGCFEIWWLITAVVDKGSGVRQGPVKAGGTAQIRTPRGSTLYSRVDRPRETNRSQDL